MLGRTADVTSIELTQLTDERLDMAYSHFAQLVEKRAVASQDVISLFVEQAMAPERQLGRKGQM